MILREIQKKDNRVVAHLIRQILTEFSLDKKGTAYYDPQLDDLTAYYNEYDKAAYFVIEDGGEIIASGGFAPISSAVAELQKLYVKKECRGRGLSTLLMDKILKEAQSNGYQQIYLETTSLLPQAVSVYKKYGFKHLDAPLENENGHSAMDIWMIKTFNMDLEL